MHIIDSGYVYDGRRAPAHQQNCAFTTICRMQDGTIIVSGRWAPLALLLVAGLLYFFRSIYAEVVGALPLNGGAYNALLNTTSKFRASIAACLTILSYMATAVLSADTAIHYLQ